MPYSDSSDSENESVNPAFSFLRSRSPGERMLYSENYASEDENPLALVSDPGVSYSESSASEDDTEAVSYWRTEDVDRQLIELQAIFYKHGMTRACQADILRYGRNMKLNTQKKLPKDGRSFQPSIQPPEVTHMPPGEFAYFGISSMLNECGDKLFDPSQNTVRLSIHIDGVPLFHSSDYNLWPLHGSVDQKPVFIIGFYGGKSKPYCSNQYLKPLVNEICALKQNGIMIKNHVYSFVLNNIMMDFPARSYILGV